MHGSPYLFTHGELFHVLRARQRDASEAVAKLDPDDLLSTPEADVTERLAGRYTINCPVLRRDRAELLPVTDQFRPARDAFTSHENQEPQARQVVVVMAVPFDGDSEVFLYRASRFGSQLPMAIVHDGELRYTWSAPGPDAAAAAVRAYMDKELGRTEQHLAWARTDIDRYNTDVRALIALSVSERRAWLLASRDLESAIGLPVRRRADAAVFAVPMTHGSSQPGLSTSCLPSHIPVSSRWESTADWATSSPTR